MNQFEFTRLNGSKAGWMHASRPSRQLPLFTELSNHYLDHRLRCLQGLTVVDNLKENT